MPKIIWYGNKSWDEIFNNDQPWDEEIKKKSIPGDAKLLERPDDFVKGATAYAVVPIVLCIFIIMLKRGTSQELIIDPRLMPISIILGFIIGLPVHEWLHAICFPKGEKVYIGVSLKQLRAFAVSSAALSRERFIVMSLMPMVPGLISMTVILLCPLSMKWLITLCLFPMCMGLISPAPDYMDVILLLRQVPKGAMIQPTEDGLVWYRQG